MEAEAADAPAQVSKHTYIVCVIVHSPSLHIKQLTAIHGQMVCSCLIAPPPLAHAFAHPRSLSPPEIAEPHLPQYALNFYVQEQPADASAPEVGNAEVPEAAAPAAPAEEAAPASSGEGNDGAAPLEGEGQEGAGYDAHKEPGTGPEPEDGQFREAMATEGEAAEGEAGQEATDLGEEGGEGADTSTAPDQSAVLAVKAAPPPEPELEPLPEDYVPVAQLPTLPEPYARNEGGKPIPLAGVESLFLTGESMSPALHMHGMRKCRSVVHQLTCVYAANMLSLPCNSARWYLAVCAGFGFRKHACSMAAQLLKCMMMQLLSALHKNAQLSHTACRHCMAIACQPCGCAAQYALSPCLATMPAPRPVPETQLMP